MSIERVQIGRNGPQFSFAHLDGRAYVLDHGIGHTVADESRKVCAFLHQYLGGLADGHIAIWDAKGTWSRLNVEGGRFAGLVDGVPPGDEAVGVQAFEGIERKPVLRVHKEQPDKVACAGA